MRARRVLFLLIFAGGCDALPVSAGRDPRQLASDILEHGIVLTGGGSLIRGLDQLLMDETGLPVRVDDDPLTSVVRGTGRILDDFARYGNVLTT